MECQIRVIRVIRVNRVRRRGRGGNCKQFKEERASAGRAKREVQKATGNEETATRGAMKENARRGVRV
jgi:hypothetical protein